MKKITNSWHKKIYDRAFASSTLASPSFVFDAKKQIQFLNTELNLKKGSKILDVPCGVGRHSIAFAKKGHFITGVDISRDCLKIARRKFCHKNIKYELGNMSELNKYKSKFDVVTNLFTSFGYFSTDNENELVLRQMKNCLKPGGQLAMSLMDRDWLKRNFNSPRWTENKQGIIHIEHSIMNWKTGYIITDWIILQRSNKGLQQLHQHTHRIKIYRKSELIKLFKKIGFKKIRVFDGYNHKKYKAGVSHHPLYIAQM